MTADPRPAPTACCPHDGEPLILTFERPKYEFLCMVCGRWYDFISPQAKVPTAELEARYQELLAAFRDGARHWPPVDEVWKVNEIRYLRDPAYHAGVHLIGNLLKTVMLNPDSWAF